MYMKLSTNMNFKKTNKYQSLNILIMDKNYKNLT